MRALLTISALGNVLLLIALVCVAILGDREEQDLVQRNHDYRAMEYLAHRTWDTLSHCYIQVGLEPLPPFDVHTSPFEGPPEEKNP
jgi:hypothetical protein